MATQTKPLNLYEKLAKIGEAVKILRKERSGYNYTYVAEEDILARIHGGMREHNVSLIPSIVPGTTSWSPRDYVKTRTTKNGNQYEEKINEMLVNGEMVFTWVNNDNPDEKLEVPWYFIGQQSDASQAYGSALTYSGRYFLLRFFNIATTKDDPDKLRSKQKEEEAKREAEVLKDIIGQIDNVIAEAIKKDENNKDKLLKLVEETIGTKLYRNIKKTEEAAELLREITEAI